MGNFHKVMLTIASLLIAASIATPAAATNVDQALAICKSRGSTDCHAMKATSDGATTIICINNTGGIQCVSCPPKSEGDCKVSRVIPVTRRGVEGILNNNTKAR